MRSDSPSRPNISPWEDEFLTRVLEWGEDEAIVADDVIRKYWDARNPGAFIRATEKGWAFPWRTMQHVLASFDLDHLAAADSVVRLGLVPADVDERGGRPHYGEDEAQWTRFFKACRLMVSNGGILLAPDWLLLFGRLAHALRGGHPECNFDQTSFPAAIKLQLYSRSHKGGRVPDPRLVWRRRKLRRAVEQAVKANRDLSRTDAMFQVAEENGVKYETVWEAVYRDHNKINDLGE